MKKILIFVFLSYITAGIAIGQETYNVAIVKMQVSGGIPESYSVAFTDRLRVELFNTGAFNVMERNEMDEILKEQGFQMSGCTTDECFVQVGKILGVNHIVAGSVSKIGNLYTITLRLISVETSKTIKAIPVDYKGEVEELASSKMKEAAQMLAGQQVISTSSSNYTSSPQPSVTSVLPGVSFVKIPSGSFQMGSNEYNNEKPIHTVNIQSFYMMTTEVTQAQWTAIMGNNPSNWKGDNLPIEGVSWNDAQDFLRKLNQKDPGKNYRLPSEAEWEYACRAGTTTRFYSGDNDNDLDAIAWYFSNSGYNTHPVGQKRANAWGLYDMSGNVWEWCQDWYHDSYYGAPLDGSAWESPRGSHRVLRGGSWSSLPNCCRSAFRFINDPDDRNINIGFRLVRSL